MFGSSRAAGARWNIVAASVGSRVPSACVCDCAKVEYRAIIVECASCSVGQVTIIVDGTVVVDRLVVIECAVDVDRDVILVCYYAVVVHTIACSVFYDHLAGLADSNTSIFVKASTAGSCVTYVDQAAVVENARSGGVLESHTVYAAVIDSYLAVLAICDIADVVQPVASLASVTDQDLPSFCVGKVSLIVQACDTQAVVDCDCAKIGQIAAIVVDPVAIVCIVVDANRGIVDEFTPVAVQSVATGPGVTDDHTAVIGRKSLGEIQSVAIFTGVADCYISMLTVNESSIHYKDHAGAVRAAVLDRDVAVVGQCARNTKLLRAKHGNTEAIVLAVYNGDIPVVFLCAHAQKAKRASGVIHNHRYVICEAVRVGKSVIPASAVSDVEHSVVGHCTGVGIVQAKAHVAVVTDSKSYIVGDAAAPAVQPHTKLSVVRKNHFGVVSQGSCVPQTGAIHGSVIDHECAIVCYAGRADVDYASAENTVVLDRDYAAGAVCESAKVGKTVASAIFKHNCPSICQSTTVGKSISACWTSNPDGKCAKIVE